MLRGIETATSGMIALQRKQDALTNNLANVETPGYKQDTSPLRSFPNMLLERIRGGGQDKPYIEEIGKLSLGVYNQEILPIFSQGMLTETNQPFDIAIEDQRLPLSEVNGKYIKTTAFFAVQTGDNSIRLTRNGSFTVNENGRLATATGEVVLGRNGQPISHPSLASGDIEIRENGDIVLHPGDPTKASIIGSLGIVLVNDPNQLVKEGNGLFWLEGATTDLIQQSHPEAVTLHHKMLEQSNVDLAQTITEMMTNIRLYEANQKVLQAYDKTLEQLNSIGKV